MAKETLIGLVGKPSSGKSTTLNSLTDATAKTGAFPFTTIDPNKATGYLQIDCACARFGKESQCNPYYGSCVNGKRSVPIMLLDVAGLVPGAHQGRGLGNKFLDDLRHADALIHVVDVSGTTDSEGKATRGYDPINDIEWLRSEIVRWVEGNLMDRWGSIKRRHSAIKATAVDTLQNQFSGYGSTHAMVAKFLDKLKIKEPLESWDKDTVSQVVNAFVDEKFPTVLALNKIDHPDADKNISKIVRKYGSSKIVLTSAVSEVFLRKLVKQGFVKYEEGTEFLDTYDDLPDSGLKPLDEKLKSRIENLRDLVLFRFGSTGVTQALKAAVDILELVPVYPVKNINNFCDGKISNGVFRNCVLFKRGTTVGAIAKKIVGDANIAFIEGVGGSRVSEEDTIDNGKNDILSFRFGASA